VHVPFFIGGLATGTVGIGFFLLPDPTHAMLHSFWHVFIAVAFLLLQEAVYYPSQNKYARMAET
jgi:hypothetical protein